MQLRRSKGWRLPPDTVKVDRSTRWGNPFCASTAGRPGTAQVRLASGTRWSSRSDWTAADTVVMYDAWMRGRPLHDPATGTPLPAPVVDALPPRPDVRSLKGRHLACWCRSDQPCHAEVLLRLAAAAPAD